MATKIKARVQKRRPDATCERTIYGAFVVIEANGNVIGKGRTPVAAWWNAYLKLPD